MTHAYLDHNATSPLRPQARDALLEGLERVGNPNSVHAHGRSAHALLEGARDRLANVLNAPRGGVTFTSGATEAIDLALASALDAGARRILVSAVEHDAAQAPSRRAVEAGVERVEIGVDAQGLLDLEALERALEDPAPCVVVVMAANNETGVCSPLADVARLVRGHGNARLLVDGAQFFGKLPLDFAALGADYLALSAHKLGGPLGIGALVAAPDAPIAARLIGGGQEQGRRAGTQNAPAAAGFAAAALAAVSDLDGFAERAAWRDALEGAVLASRPDARVFGAGAPRLPNTLSLAVPGLGAEATVMALDLGGVSISAGAACSSGKMRPSLVAMAMGASADLAACAVRFSLGWSSTYEDVARAQEVWTRFADQHARRHSAPTTAGSPHSGAARKETAA